MNIVLLIFLVILIMAIISMLIDSNRFVVRTVEVSSDKLERDVDVLFISDLHCKKYGKDNKKLLSVLSTINADVAFVAGDMITAHLKRDYVDAIPVLKSIRERMPIYYSMGNHEHRLRLYDDYFAGRYEEYVKLLEDIDVHMIDNSMEKYGNINVYGLTLEDKYYLKFDRAHLSQDEVKALLPEIEDGFNVLLAHNPDYMDAYKGFSADLILSGHYHGGVMRLPFVGGVIAPSLKLFPKYSGGLYKEGNVNILVNKGLGAHTIPIRIFNPAEIIILKLKKH